jgi:SAM-dependent methyltransferase
MTPHRTKPLGQPTRGKTALNRLRQIDVYVALDWSDDLRGGSPLVVDVGFGAYAWTTLEMRDRWLRFNPRLRVLGIEIDPERVEVAQPYADPPAIEFKLGGFNVLDVIGGDHARLIRCYNVLRQYDESAVDDALQTMGRALEPGGILIEGTCNPSGRLVAFDVYRKIEDRLNHEALVFGTNFRGPVDPGDFQAILPKRLIHHMLDPVPSAFFAAWKQAFARAKGSGHSGRSQWQIAAELLRSTYSVDTRSRITQRGFLAVYDPLL